MLKITNSVTPITGNTLVILSLPANLMMKIIKKRSVLICLSPFLSTGGMILGNDSNLLIVFYVQIMPDDFVMQLHRF